MKNYGVRRLRSRRQEPLKVSCRDALRRGIPIRVLLDNNVNFSGIGFGLIVPSITWDGRAERGWELLGWFCPRGGRRLRIRSGGFCCTRRRFSSRGNLRRLSAHGF